VSFSSARGERSNLQQPPSRDVRSMSAVEPKEGVLASFSTSLKQTLQQAVITLMTLMQSHHDFFPCRTQQLSLETYHETPVTSKRPQPSGGRI
jgi:hypothetical protein